MRSSADPGRLVLDLGITRSDVVLLLPEAAHLGERPARGHVAPPPPPRVAGIDEEPAASLARAGGDHPALDANGTWARRLVDLLEKILAQDSMGGHW